MCPILPLLFPIVFQGALAPAFVDYSEDLRRPGVSVVFGAMGKYTEVRKERIADKDAVQTFGPVTWNAIGSVHYKVEAQADVKIEEVLHGDVKGTSVPVVFDLQLTKLNDGSERTCFLTKPAVAFSLPANGVFVVERVKGKKALRVVKYAKHDPLDEASGDPQATVRKRVRDQHAINLRKAELSDALEKAAAAKSAEEKTAARARLQALADAKPTYRLPESDSVALMQLSALEKRVKDALQADGGAGDRKEPPSDKGEKPPA